MPRYFFHVHDGVSILDDTGLDLPDLAAAQAVAFRLSGEILIEGEMGPLWDELQWQVEVTDSPVPGGRRYFAIQFSMT